MNTCLSPRVDAHRQPPRTPARVLLSCLLALSALGLYSCAEDENPENSPPVIQTLTSDRDTLEYSTPGLFDNRVTLQCRATDENGDSLVLTWSTAWGTFPDGNQGAEVHWLAPRWPMPHWITVQVDDGSFVTTDSLRIQIIEWIESPPVARFKVHPVFGSHQTVFTFDASYSSDYRTSRDSLEVSWDFDGDGDWDTEWSHEKIVTHQFPHVGIFPVHLQVRDSEGLVSTCSTEVLVRNPVPEMSMEMIPVPPGTISLGRFEVTNLQYVTALNWALEEGLLDFSGQTVRQHGKSLFTMGPESEIRFHPEFNVFYLDPGQGNQDGYGPGAAYPDGYDPANHPVQGIYWFGAAAFCDWLSAISGLTPYYEGNWERPDLLAEGYRLPTTIEWREAARYPDNRVYPWGNETPDCDHAEFKPDMYCSGWTRPVGSFPLGVSSLGFHDMAGNVREFCHGFTHLGGPYNYVLAWTKGGSFREPAGELQCAPGWGDLYVLTSTGYGFRVCRANP